MIRSIEIRFSENCIDYLTGPKLHGVLFKVMDKSYADYVHRCNLKPFSQYALKRKEGSVWRINFLDDASFENIGLPILSDDFKSIRLGHIDHDVAICDKRITDELSYDDIIDSQFGGFAEGKLHIGFVTPAAFRTKNRYEIMPVLRLIIQSIAIKWNQFSNISHIYYDELSEGAEYAVNMTDIDIKSKKFYVDGKKLSGFVGSVDYSMRSSQEADMLALILRYGEFTGVGIKTPLGMGAVKCAIM